MHKGVVNVINSTIVQNDVIMGRFIKSMNMVIGAQYDYVIMQLMIGKVIIMYDMPSWKITTNLLRNCTSSYIMVDMGIQDATRQS